MTDSSGGREKLCHYYGGGSVDAILPRIDFTVPRAKLGALSNGTVHYRGIACLLHGFGELDQLGGVEQIQRHCRSIAREFVQRLQKLRHGNGQSVVRVYGPWSKVSTESEGVQQLPGPTIPFNLSRADGSLVGYNEVSKLAALHNPPIQLRTGCFCNPGACQEVLGLSDEDIQRNYHENGHICGDQIDIIDDKPTGAVRASFGKDSLWEDMDVLVTFIERTFCSQPSKEQQIVTETSEPIVSQVLISEMYIFPVKSCSAQRVSKWKMDMSTGRLLFDREFALVDAGGSAMRLQHYPQMTQIKPQIDLEKQVMIVSAPGMDDLVLSLDEGTCHHQQDQQLHSGIVQVCGNKCRGQVWGGYKAAEWFSNCLGVQCWLARYFGARNMGNQHVSPSRDQGVAFANERSLLLISEHAVDRLNEILVSQGQPRVETRHFRPNLVVRGNGQKGFFDKTGNLEDQWKSLTFSQCNMKLEVVGECARCQMVDIDPQSGRKGKTLRALADYRRSSGRLTFGVFLHCKGNREEDGEAAWIKEGCTLNCE
jgi:molybdenum cofactor sulfurtransferase